jgi:tRNA(adenine34) deaminase
MILNDEYWMRLALKEASYALQEDEVPIGAIIVSANRIVGKGYNQVERLIDVTAHAEMIALTAASHALGAKYLETCTLYVTVEPCPMCAAALRWARMGRVVYGAADEKSGYSLFGSSMFHPRTEVVAGLMEHDCGLMMTDFFKSKRDKS